MVFGGSAFFEKYPFALPNLVASLFFLVGLFTGFLFLKETLESRKHRRDYGRVIGNLLLQAIPREKKRLMWQHRDEQASSLLKHSRMSSASTIGEGYDAQPQHKIIKHAPPSYREVISYFDISRSTSLFLHSRVAIPFTFYLHHLIKKIETNTH